MGLLASGDAAPPRLTRIISSVGADVDLTVDPADNTRRFNGYCTRIYSVGGATLVVRMPGDGGTASTLVLAAKEQREGQFSKIVASGSSITGNLEVSWRS